MLPRSLFVGLCLACGAVSPLATAAEPFDVVIRGGRIVDGTGAAWYYGDVGVRSGMIAAIGDLSDAEATEVVDASGLIVAPGFIDMMGQTATPLLSDSSAALNLLSQGITTINAGEGVSAAPLDEEDAERQGWSTFAEYFQLLELKGIPINVVQTIGHTQVRRIVLGEVDRRPFPDELDRMRALVRQAMEDGAIGVSTALIYPPAVYAATEEIAALAAVAGEYGGRYFTHMRNEGDRLLEAIDEALAIGQAAGTPVHIFHLKAAGQGNWAKIDQAVAKIAAARAAGMQVGADVYPYVNNGLDLISFVHPRHMTAGAADLRRRLDDAELRAKIRNEMENEPGWENWFRHAGSDWNRVVLGRIGASEYAKFAGQSIGQIAGQTEEDPWDVFFKIVREDAFACPQTMSEANKIKLMRQEFMSFCTDVGPDGGAGFASHPRAYGSFPRIFTRYVREYGAVSLEAAVARASAYAANEIGAYDRGRIAVGLAADLVVFDFERFADRADFANPHALSVGMHSVLVNGQIVYRDGELTDARGGRVLRGPGWKSESAPAEVVSGNADERFAPFDEMMQEFLRTYHVPGAAIAVLDQGRLVYARGYGYSDLASRTPATPETLSRIASISKPVTAAAVMQLVERGKLSLDDRVFDLLDDYEPVLDEGASYDARQDAITIGQLLHHTGGWDRDASFDAMFRAVSIAERLGVDPPAGPDQVIRYMLGQPLDFDPGAKYAYSNYGYCLLGRVIEKLTGTPYGDYVREHVLGPAGAATMQLGATRLAGRVDGETRYYDSNSGPSVFAADLGQTVPSAYGAWNLEAMDSHGGWIASALDLARFASALDRAEASPILSAESIAQLATRPGGDPGYEEDGTPKATHYGLGWMVRTLDDGAQNLWHTGSLPGTATLLVRRSDGRSWVVLLNARQSGSIDHLTRTIDPLMHQAADAVTDWPEGDLFEE